MTSTAIALFVLSAALAGGQVADQDDPPVEFRPDAQQPDVYLNDSFEADDWIAKAVRLTRQGQWEEAVALLNRVVDVHADKLTRTGPGCYINVLDRVGQLLAGWPTEGLAAYRRLAEPVARQQLLSAQRDRRVDLLLDVADRYFCTQAGWEAAEFAARMAVESGDFPLAVRMYRRLLNDHPDGQRSADHLVGRLAVVYALWGRAERARELAGRAGEAASVEWTGQAQPLRDLVESLLNEVHQTEQATGLSSWPTFGGDPARNSSVDFGIDDRLAVLWRLGGVGEAGEDPDVEESSSYQQADGKGRLLSTNPVVADQVAYIHDNRTIRALQLATGRLLWSHAGLADSMSEALYADGELPSWFGPTIVAGRLYACLGREKIPYYGYDTPESLSALVCLDAETGETLWRADRASLGTTFEEMEFESAPIVTGGKVYVVARRKRPFGFQDCFLYRLDADTGREELRTHLGSASTGGFGYRRPTLAIPALYDDVVYVATNLATLAAVDRHTGRVRWLRLYERISEARWRREGRGSTRELSPWHYNAVICDGDKIYALPTDADSLMVLDRSSGDVQRTIAVEDLADVQTVLGVRGALIYGVGDRVFCYDLEAGEMSWESPLPEDDELLGRGLLTDRQVLLPGRTSLCVFDLATGRCSAQPWDSPGDAGNLVAVSGTLLVAGADRVTAYALKAEVLGRLRSRMASAPQDPLPALELAEILIRAGDVPEGLGALDEAVARAGGFAGPIEQNVKRRIFDDCLAFARILLAGSEPDHEQISSLYKRASQCPQNTADHLEYRMRWAAMLEQAGRWDEAVALYQQIIADRTLAGAEYTDGIGGTDLAGYLAEARVAQLIEHHGRQVYERYDQQASQWLAAGRSAGDVELLNRVVESFPNARAAPMAMQAKGRLLQDRGECLEAARAFYTALLRFPLQVDAPAIMRQIAECYIQAGEPDQAWRWLTKAAREYPQFTFEVDGRRTTFAEYREKLGDVRALVELSRPHVDLPLQPDPPAVREFDKPFWLLDPRFADTPGASWRLAIVYTAGTVQAYDARSNLEAWATPAECPELPELLLTTPSRVVLATRFQIIGLDAETGTCVWRHGQRPAGVDAANSDPEDFPILVGFALAEGSIVGLRNDGYAARVEIVNGQTVWQAQLEHRPFGPVAAGVGWVVYQALRFGDPSYCILDAATGELVRVIESVDLPGAALAGHLFFTLEGHLISVTAQSVRCVDPASGRLVWLVHREDGVRPGSVRLDVDGLYLSDDGERVEKLRPTDGRLMWRSELPASRWRHSAHGMTVDLHDGQVVVSAEKGVYALSARDGRVLWEGDFRRGMTFRHRLLSGDYLVGIDTPPEHFEEEYAAHFYDLANASGVVPADGGIRQLGVFDDVKNITLRDGALLLQDGRKLYIWLSRSRNDQ